MIDKEERLALISDTNKLIASYDHFIEEVGGDVYFQVNKEKQFFFSVEINANYAEFYSPFGHKIISDEQEFYCEKVLNLVSELCISLSS